MAEQRFPIPSPRDARRASPAPNPLGGGLMGIDEPVQPSTPRGFALWALGFRPFYLLAGAYGSLAVLLWGLQSTGVVAAQPWRGPAWHAHEMLFGFALAVVVGFLLTAGRNWSNQPTPSGAALAALVALWIVARVLAFTPWFGAGLLANLAFAWLAALGLGQALWRGHSSRNYFFVAVLLLLGLASVMFHLVQMDRLALPEWAGLQIALDALLFVVAVMAGRVVPMFSNDGVRGMNARRDPRLEPVALGLLLALMAGDMAGLPGPVRGALAFAAAAAHLGRWVLWQPWRALRHPIVWILQLGYAWVWIHLLLRGAAEFGWIARSLSAHALTVGAIGALTIGMMMRTARGHTGRPLQFSPPEVVACWLVALSAPVRVLLPLLWPAAIREALLVSSVLWSLGFGLFTVVFFPWLLRPRVDGRPG